ncbi:MAG TPA: HAD-IC family P-type ATPase [Rectinemataceae bacterium]|nr:HAD-IC family P-type ATPase [Rectinemataceae bacterium]
MKAKVDKKPDRYGFTRKMLLAAVGAAFRKLDPRVEIRNPVMFLVWLGSLLCTAVAVAEALGGTAPSGFTIQIILWLWFTLVFANFAESVAEVQGKARADSLRKMRKAVVAHRRRPDGATVDVASVELRPGDEVVCEAGDIIPGDGEVVEGIASVDESAITGESAPVIRESGGDRSGVTGGTRVISDRIVIRITAEPGNTFIDKMILMVENATRQKTPGEIALTILLAALSLIFLLAVVTLYPFSLYIASQAKTPDALDILTLTALLVCLIPTTIGGLLSAIGISGVSRLIKKNVMALSGRAIEAAGDIDTLLLDKTGTITYGNRMASEIVVRKGVSEAELARATLAASLADDTPEGKSIVQFVRAKYGAAYAEDAVTGAEGAATYAEGAATGPEGAAPRAGSGGTFVPFTAKTRMSGMDFAGPDGLVDASASVRKGAMDSVRDFVASLGGAYPEDLKAAGERIARSGGTPLAVAVGKDMLGVIHLKDVIKEGVRERLAGLHAIGIRTVMITGDNRLTAATIAAEAGVTDYIAESRPEDKLEIIRKEQREGHLVGMIGDGTNDAPALAQADVGVAMASGTQTAREAGNMIDFDNHPAKVIDVVEVGKQLLITRGSLTTFSIANDVAKYFAILPAVFSGFYAAAGANLGAAGAKVGPLAALNIMRLATPESAILSAVVFNALIIVALIPLALRGVKFSPKGGASRLLRRNLLVYGGGGIVVPFIGIKVVDLLLHGLGLI